MIYRPKILKIEINEEDVSELKVLLDAIEKDPSKAELTRTIVKIINQVPRG